MRFLVTDTTWNMAILARYLREAGEFVSEAADGEDLLHLASAGRQNAILIDADLPDVDLIPLIRRLRAEHPRTVICVFDRNPTEDRRTRAMLHGADDVVASPGDFRAIHSQLQAYVRRASGYAEALLDCSDLKIDITKRHVTHAGLMIHLTRLEYELVEFLALRNGGLVTRDEIMLQLYAWEKEPDPKIIDVYICRIRAKLTAAGAPDDVIVTSFAQGVRLQIYRAVPIRKAA